MDTSEAVTFSIAGFFALLAILIFLRLLLRKGEPRWLSIKLGVYIERVPREHDDGLPPTTYLPPRREP